MILFKVVVNFHLCQIQIGIAYTTSYYNDIGEAIDLILESLEEDTKSIWQDHFLDICHSSLRPSKNIPWKLILKFKTRKNGLLKVDNLGLCSLHASGTNNACQKTFMMTTNYLTVSSLQFHALLVLYLPIRHQASVGKLPLLASRISLKTYLIILTGKIP